MYKCIRVKEKEDKKLFLSLPSKLYKKDSPQDVRCEQQLLDGTHPLSKDFKFVPFVVVNNEDEPLCRCAVTFYPKDKTAYVGFFESINDVGPVRFMFQHVKRTVFGHGCKEMLGPVDASIFINYRFKADNFDRTYTGEPYNKNYYIDLWKQCGFEISDTYVSNQLRRVRRSDLDVRMEKICNRFLARGFEIKTPTDETFQKCLIQVYQLMMKKYSGFTGFHRISGSQFMTMYSDLKKIANYDMIKLMYKDNELKGFCVCVPNYGFLTRGKMSVNKLIKISKIKQNPKEYVVLYVGVDDSAVGLSGALIHQIRNELLKNQCTSIGALIKEGNVTGKMYEDLYVKQYKYVLMKRKMVVNV